MQGKAAQIPLNQRVLIVYNSANSDSVSVANYYATVRGIPTANLCPITPPTTTRLTWAQYVPAVRTPIQNCLNAVGARNILYIVFTYQTPYTVLGSTSPLLFAMDSYVADIWDQYTKQDFYPYPTVNQPYFDDAQSQGNVYLPFMSFDNYRQHVGQAVKPIYSVWRLDGASADLAKGLVDKAVAAEGSGLSGEACLDRKNGSMPNIYDSDYGEGEWDLHQAATFAGQTGFLVTEDSNTAEFGTPPAPDCPEAALYSGWYSLDHYNDAFTWNTGAIGFHLDSLSALDPRGGTSWSANAISKGITVTSGAMNEPYLQGLLRPGGTFRDLFQGANVGDAFLRNTRWLKWMILNFGDPLYRPFPNGLSPFNPPPPQASLALSTRYVINGDSATGTVTLANPAPSGGTVVPLSSSRTSLVQVPASVTVLQGQRTATFTATTAATPLVTLDTPAAITASGVGKNSLTVVPLLSTIMLHPTSIIGGASSAGLLLLNANAPAGGTVVALSANSQSVSVPPTVTVPQGASQVTFTVNSSFVSTTTPTVITATLNGASATANLNLQPALVSMSAVPPSAPGGAQAQLHLVLGAQAPTGGWQVNLSTDNPGVASLPSVVTVPAGNLSYGAPITGTPQCSDHAVTLTARSGVSVLNTPFTVTPPPPTSVSFNGTVRGGSNVVATATIRYPACAAGLPVSVTSDNPAVASVPPTVTIPGGRTSATFTITTTPVTSTTVVNISITSDSVTKSKLLTVTP